MRLSQAAEKVPRRLGHVARRLRRRLAAWFSRSGGTPPRPPDRGLCPLYPRSCEFFSTLFSPPFPVQFLANPGAPIFVREAIVTLMV